VRRRRTKGTKNQMAKVLNKKKARQIKQKEAE